MAKSQSFRESDYDLVLDACTNGQEVVVNGKVERRGGNQNVWFIPAGVSLHGEIRAEWLHSSRVPGAILQVGGVIPGHRLLVDTKGRTAKIIDRLSLPEHAKLVEQLRVIGQTERYWHARFDALRKDVDFNIADDEFAKWMYCIRRCVDHGTLQLVRGTVPTLEECRKLGTITFNNANGISLKDTKNPFNVLRPPAQAAVTAKS